MQHMPCTHSHMIKIIKQNSCMSCDPLSLHTSNETWNMPLARGSRVKNMEKAGEGECLDFLMWALNSFSAFEQLSFSSRGVWALSVTTMRSEFVCSGLRKETLKLTATEFHWFDSISRCPCIWWICQAHEMGLEMGNVVFEVQCHTIVLFHSGFVWAPFFNTSIEIG